MRPERKHVPAVLAGVVCLAAAPVVEASTDNFVEMQIASVELSYVVRTHLQTQAEFCPHSVPCPYSSGLCIVDRLEFPSVGTWTRGAPTSVVVNNHTSLSSTKILYEQPMVAHVKTQSCAFQPGCQTTTQLPATLTVEMTGGQGSSLCFAPQPPTGLPVAVNVPLTPFCVDLDLAAVKALTGNPGSSITGQAATLSTGGSRVGFRFEIDRPQNTYDSARVNAWADFLAGQLAAGNPSHEWSLFAHQSLLRESVKTMFEDAVASSPELGLLGNPITSWAGLGSSGGMVNLSVGAEYDSCIDISPLTLSAQTSINNASNGLDTHGTVDWDVDEWDAFWCGMADGFIVGAIAAPIIASSVDLNDLGTVFGPCQVVGGHDFECTQQTHPQVTVLGHGWSLKSFLSAVYGDSSGLVMSGSLTQLGAGIPDIEAALQTPAFGYQGGCYDSECGYLGGVYLSGNAKLCDVQFTNDPLNVFEVEPPASLDLPATYHVRVHPGLSDAVKNQYNSYPPYGMKVTVFSSSGVETYQFDPTELLPVGSNNLMDSEAFLCAAWNIKDWATNCLKPKWRPGESRLHPEWVIDPWDHVVIVMDDRAMVEIGVGLVEQMALRPIWDAAGRSIVGISLTGVAHLPQGEERANTQAIQIDAGLPRGVTAGSLEEAIAVGFRRGLNETVSVDRAYLPSGVASASFELSFDQALLFDMASP